LKLVIVIVAVDLDISLEIVKLQSILSKCIKSCNVYSLDRGKLIR
jgi:hypothetical protein